MARLTLIRGLPGSGKSTLARELCARSGALHVETDQYFLRAGVYAFAAEDLPEAHAWCLECTRAALASGRAVVVSNTFVRIWEMQPYLDLGVPTEIVEARGAYANIHGVPETVIQSMRAEWEKLP